MESDIRIQLDNVYIILDGGSCKALYTANIIMRAEKFPQLPGQNPCSGTKER